MIEPFLNEEYVLTVMIFTPIVGAFLLLFIPARLKNTIRWLSAYFTLIPLLLAIYIFLRFDRASPGFPEDMQFVQQVPWIPLFGVEYYVGIDGISGSMILLTALVNFICVFASWNIEKGVKGYYILLLILGGSIVGVFCALDFFLFFVFWELMLLPMYFLIGIWGGPRREYAAIKFFLYTLLGSVFMLVVLLVFYFHPDCRTLNLVELAQKGKDLKGALWVWMFVFLYIGFAIKVPVFPFHTWLPDAHVEAPTPISVILASLLLKMGLYGFMRISFPILPNQAEMFLYPFAILGLINIFYGAFCAMAQNDMKKLVAYSSVSHMGYCLLGMAAINSEGMNGALLQMFNHGTITGMLFLIVGVIYDRAHHRDIDKFGGLATKVPVYAGITSLAFFASLGLPGLSGFVGEVLSLIGGFEKYKVIAALCTACAVITAGYFLWCLQRIFLGPFNKRYEDLTDVNFREMFCLIPLAIITVIIGVYPSVAIDFIGNSLESIINIVVK